MNGHARIVGSVARGSCYRVGSITASAVAFGRVTASGMSGLKEMTADGSRTQEAGLLHWLNVTPTAEQHLVWIVPQVGIDYEIDTSTGLEWSIK